jgi:hypothetical protein
MAKRHHPWRPCRDFVVEEGVRRYCTRRLYHLGDHEHGVALGQEAHPEPKDGFRHAGLVRGAVSDMPYHIFLVP